MAIVGYALLGIAALALVWFAVEKSRRQTRPVTGGLDPSVSLPYSAEVELYSNAFSHCSRKTRLVLAELGIEAKHHSIELIETGWYQTISASYLKVNPSGLVPTLVHKGNPVFESDDILAYAQAIAPADAPQLVPSDPRLHAEMEDWLDFCSISSADAMAGMERRAGACIPGLTMPLFVTAIQHIPLRNILVGFLFHFDKQRPALFTASKLLGLRFMMQHSPARPIMQESRDHMRKHLLRLNAALAEDERQWILGADYSLADVSLSCVLLRLEETGWLEWFEKAEAIGQVSAYYARLKAREAWSEAISAQAHPIVELAKRDLRVAVSEDPALGEMIYGRISDGPARLKEVA